MEYEHEQQDRRLIRWDALHTHTHRRPLAMSMRSNSHANQGPPGWALFPTAAPAPLLLMRSEQEEGRTLLINDAESC